MYASFLLKYLFLLYELIWLTVSFPWWVLRSRDYYRSQVHSRSISRSPSHDDRDYRRSPNQSPRDDKDHKRSPSPRENGRGRSDERHRAQSRSRSPRENGRSRYDERGRKPSRSRSPRGKSRSPLRSRSRSYR